MSGHIAWITKGFGYGHAAKDLPVLEAIRLSEPRLRVTLASAGLGLEYYRQRGVPCHDLGISDDGSDRGARSSQLIHEHLARTGGCDLLVGHESWEAVPVSRRFRVPCVILTHWFFTEVGRPDMDQALLAGANAIVVLDSPAAHHQPDFLTQPITFTGSIANLFATDQATARHNLGLVGPGRVIVASLGAFRERKIPALTGILETILRAWRHDVCPADRLLILGPRVLFEPIASLEDDRVQWVGLTQRAAEYHAAADLVLAANTYTTLSELVRNRCQVISFENSDPIDTLHSDFFRSRNLIQVVAKPAREGAATVEPRMLWGQMESVMNRPAPTGPTPPDVVWADPGTVAKAVLSQLRNQTVNFSWHVD